MLAVTAGGKTACPSSRRGLHVATCRRLLSSYRIVPFCLWENPSRLQGGGCYAYGAARMCVAWLVGGGRDMSRTAAPSRHIPARSAALRHRVPAAAAVGIWNRFAWLLDSYHDAALCVCLRRGVTAIWA